MNMITPRQIWIFAHILDGKGYQEGDHVVLWILLAVAIVVVSFLTVFLFRALRRLHDSSLSLDQLKLKNIMGRSSGVAILVVDKGGHVVQVNNGFETVLGYELEDIKGHSVFNFLFVLEEIEKMRQEVSDEDELTPDDKLLSSAVRVGSGEREIKCLQRDGTHLPVNLTIHTITDNSGDEVGFLIVAADLSEKYRIQRELEESQIFLRSVIDAIPTRIFWKDRNLTYLGCNKAFAGDTGFKSVSDVVGLKDSEMPWGGSGLGEEYNAVDRLVMESQTPKFNYEEPVITREGEKLTVRASKIPLHDVNHELIGVLGMYENITDYKRLQELVQKRIVAFTRYMDDPDTLEFEKLFNIDEIQRIQDEFSESTSVSSVIVGIDGSFITRSSRMSSLCKLVMNLKTDNCVDCHKLTSGLVGSATDGPMFRRCEGSGLSMAVSPIVAGGVHIASWVLGQVRIEDKSVDDLVQTASAAGIDPAAYCAAYDKVPRMTHEKFDSVAETAHTLCTQLSLFATQNLQQARLIKKEKERVEELRRFDAILKQVPDGVIIIGKDQKIQYANPAFARITGYSLEEAIGMSPMALSSDRNSRDLLEDIVSTISQGKVWSGRLINKRKDGTTYTEESVISPFFDENGQIVSAVATLRDISDELAREEQMYHRQKMAAVGQLAGGVAHDFNNILQAILGFSEMLMQKLEKGSLQYNHAEQICAASKRAAALTRGLLSLGYKDNSESDLQALDVNFMLKDSFVLFNLLSTERVEIVYDLAPDLRAVSFSNDKFYQVIVNLIINSRDAMPDGGTITITTQNVSGAEMNHADIDDDSQFVCVGVEDAGCGIPEDIRNEIFNPFYTTKEVGKGSGLGLAIVYVIIEDCGGKITFESKIGEGTKFSVYLPVKIV